MRGWQILDDEIVHPYPFDCHNETQAVLQFYERFGRQAVIDNFSLYLIAMRPSQKEMELVYEHIATDLPEWDFSRKFEPEIRDRVEKLSLLI